MIYVSNGIKQWGTWNLSLPIYTNHMTNDQHCKDALPDIDASGAIVDIDGRIPKIPLMPYVNTSPWMGVITLSYDPPALNDDAPSMRNSRHIAPPLDMPLYCSDKGSHTIVAVMVATDLKELDCYKVCGHGRPGNEESGPAGRAPYTCKNTGPHWQPQAVRCEV